MDNDPYRAGAAKLFQKPIEDVTLKERQQFKALYNNYYGSLSASSTKKAVEVAERFGTTMAPTLKES